MTKIEHNIALNPDTVIVLLEPLIQFAIWERKEAPLNPESLISSQPPLPPPASDNEPPPPLEDILTTPPRDEPFPLTEYEPGPQPEQVEAGLNSMEAEAASTEVVASSSNAPATSIFGIGYETTGMDGDGAVPLRSELDLNTDIAVKRIDEIPPTEAVQMSSQPIRAINPWEESGIHYHVSSQHLTNASAQFRRKMSGGKWKEGIRAEDGLFYTITREWDADAFLILMNVLHLRNKKIPGSVSLEMLAKIAVLVDFYECWEAIEWHSRRWINDFQLSGPVPSTYSRDLLLWICVTQVFGVVADFKAATKAAVMQSNESIRLLELPIYPRISNEMEYQRYRTLESMVTLLCDLHDKYRDPKYKCPTNYHDSFTCGSVLLGALTKQMESIGLLSPRPEVPFLGWSIQSMSEKVKQMKSPVWCNGNFDRRYYTNDCTQHECNLSTAVLSIVHSATGGVRGLDLGDFERTANNVKKDG